ncbi:unnamed protein product [Schistosoma margrebowiei]|uniref:Uncharacterized protein n=1 Tax=Schistosoma margrebowiei TaxID=48269 RepID=A0A183MSF7_9TREM|nr:unnamed protein product [Schistosoma margrebowiei]
MVVGCSRQETLDLGFVLLGTRQQGVPVILKELVDSLIDSIPCHPASQSETLPLSYLGRDRPPVELRRLSVPLIKLNLSKRNDCWVLSDFELTGLL